MRLSGLVRVFTLLQTHQQTSAFMQLQQARALKFTTLQFVAALTACYSLLMTGLVVCGTSNRITSSYALSKTQT